MNRRFSRLAMLLVLGLLQFTVTGWAEEAPDGSAGPSFEELRKQAEQGDADAQVRLGAYYYLGRGVAKDQKEAVKWYIRAAEQGHAEAQFVLGLCYYDGTGVAKDEKEAVKWYTRAAEQGIARAQYKLGRCYFLGCGVAKNPQEAVKWCTRAADQGDIDAQFHLGVCYADGEGVTKDQKAAVKWLTRAAEQGDGTAQYLLGGHYHFGEGVAKDQEEAVKWYTRAAEQGISEAQGVLAACYQYGKGVAKDLQAALKWYIRAAEQGDAESQYELGLFYKNGYFGLLPNGDKSGAKDLKKAVEWFTRSAEQGNSDAQGAIADCYENGEGVAKDQKEAVRWYTRAAEQGDAVSQYFLGRYYERGKGVSKDFIKSYMWYNLAAAAWDYQLYEEARERVAQEMTPAQIAEAQRLSAAFVPRKEGAGGASPGPSSDASPAAPDTAAPPKGTGTAFAITSDGYLVTAAHVVAGAARVVVYAGGQPYSATVVAQDAVNDVSVLKAEGAYSPVRLVSSGGLKLGEDLFTVGFPDVQVQGTAPKLTKGSVSGLLGPGDDPRYFQLSNPIQPGNSGGSVANVKGEVIGVLVGTLDLMKTIERTGQAPQNVNFALKSSYVLPLLETVPGLSAQIGKVKSPGGDAYQAVTAATVLVVVY